MNTTIIIQANGGKRVGYELVRVWYAPWKKRWKSFDGIDAELVDRGFRPSTDEEVARHSQFLECNR